MSATLKVLLEFETFLPVFVDLVKELIEADPESIANQQAKDAKIALLENQLKEAVAGSLAKDETIADQAAELAQAQADDVVGAEAVTRITDKMRELFNAALAAPVPKPVEPAIEPPAPVEVVPDAEPVVDIPADAL